jgi:hypothetical protein
MKTRKFACLIISSTVVYLVCCGLPAILVGYEINLNEWQEALSTSRFLPDAQIRFDQVYDQIRGATQDTLVSEEIEPLYVPATLYTGCIRATAYMMYRTHQDYQSVAADYIRLFEHMNQGAIIRPERDPRILIYRGTTVNIVVEPGDINAGSNSTYSIDLSYAEPSVRSCWG